MQIIKSGSIVTVIEQPARFFNVGANIDVNTLDESTNVEVPVSVSATFSEGLMTFSNDFDLVEGRYYFVIVSQGTEEICKFKIFCTDQTDLQNYKITDGDFVTAPQSSDEIIVAP